MGNTPSKNDHTNIAMTPNVVAGHSSSSASTSGSTSEDGGGLDDPICSGKSKMKLLCNNSPVHYSENQCPPQHAVKSQNPAYGDSQESSSHTRDQEPIYNELSLLSLGPSSLSSPHSSSKTSVSSNNVTIKNEPNKNYLFADNASSSYIFGGGKDTQSPHVASFSSSSSFGEPSPNYFPVEGQRKDALNSNWLHSPSPAIPAGTRRQSIHSTSNELYATGSSVTTNVTLSSSVSSVATNSGSSLSSFSQDSPNQSPTIAPIRSSDASSPSTLTLPSQGKTLGPQQPLTSYKPHSYRKSAPTVIGGPTVETSFKSNNHSGASPNTRPKQHAVDVNELIQRLIDAGLSSSPPSKRVCISNNEIIGICRAARSIFLSQPTLLELGTPVQVVGDIHGQYGDLMRVFQLCGMPPTSNYLFLGDYVDRGKQSIETILLLLCFKIRYPENVFLLRGNHECASVTRVYGFYDECKRRTSVKVWKTFVDTFNTFPIAATIGGKIFCVHGGLSPYLNSLDDIRSIQRPTDIPDAGLLSDLLWSDPDGSVADWRPNDRGISYCFGRSVIDSFCAKLGFDLVARGHMVVEDGYEFFNRRKLVTVFSAPNYCGEFGNWAAVMSVGKDLLCRFELLKPLDTNGVKKALKNGRAKERFVGNISTTRAVNLRHNG